MTAAIGVLAILTFSAAFLVSRLVPLAGQAATVARRVVEVLNDRGLDDDAKERAAQAASTRLLLAFVNITLRSAAVLAAPFVLIGILHRIGVVRMNEVLSFLVSPLVLSGTIAAAAVVYLVRK